jgi:signal transduction histidine kinase
MVRTAESPTGEAHSAQPLPSADIVTADAVILICDPDDALRTNIADLLRSAGYASVVAAAGIDEAVEECAALPPDVALFRANNDDGIDRAFTEALRRLNPEHAVSVVCLYADKAPAAHTAMRALCDDALSLDRDLEELPHRITTQARIRVLERALLDAHSTMEDVVAKRTSRLNRALNLLQDAEKRLEQELSQARSETRDRIDYFAETQHELRTPLNAICGMSDAIRKEMFGALDNPKYKEYAENIFQSGQHLMSLIDGRLELSRIEAGADPVEAEPVDIGGVIQETTEMLGRIAEKANVALDIEVEPDLPTIETDRRKLRQILVNLVSNAIKFTPENGRVGVSVKRNASKGVLVLVVSDDGIGMSANDVRDAMKPYRRLSGDRRSGERGMGLGLAIVRKLVETLGATIEFQSTPGKGTSVKVELPMTIPANA